MSAVGVKPAFRSVEDRLPRACFEAGFRLEMPTLLRDPVYDYSIRRFVMKCRRFMSDIMHHSSSHSGGASLYASLRPLSSRNLHVQSKGSHSAHNYKDGHTRSASRTHAIGGRVIFPIWKCRLTGNYNTLLLGLYVGPSCHYPAFRSAETTSR
ncbi:uncharacterized protein LAESUDRAFT_169348 [Laetiporus sulphureus 93-53]|uniref:Uncharacterized protein n=1 Tax=Laetiporus sulphureus 93-53 TaxID=1314785 RepID=A0A165HTD0_9APHY|nr:uncharacterized protein LAESUDRAFT_169348 [Laetiporus sulphureus 93-53]KZT12163.1 hypothetical protein LAESUDRAFT_169348 [Laetiporus sulphureus 93-53]